MDQQQRVLCVLGMHRSGTSCLAGSLQAAGLNLGEVYTQNPFNRKGNRENKAIMVLHEAVLAANGASWHQPPDQDQDPIWPKDAVEERRRIIGSFEASPLWGFKDPRALLVLSGWQADLPSLERVGIFRHPAAVAQSLIARSPQMFDQNSALALWVNYNQRLLALWRQAAFPLIEYVDDGQALQNSLRAVADRLQLPAPEQVVTFFDADLCHHSARASAKLDAKSEQLYEDLKHAARLSLS